MHQLRVLAKHPSGVSGVAPGRRPPLREPSVNARTPLEQASPVACATGLMILQTPDPAPGYGKLTKKNALALSVTVFIYVIGARVAGSVPLTETV
jgi:hypothetical protein